MIRFKASKVLTSTLIFSLLASSLAFADTGAPAQELDLTTVEMTERFDAEYSFLQQNGISQEKIAQLDVATVKSLMRQAEANAFTPKQISNYVDGQLEAKLQQAFAADGLDGVLSDDSASYTYADGTILPNLLTRHFTEEGEQLRAAPSPRSFAGDPSRITNANDETGTYWAVKSTTGWTETPSGCSILTPSPSLEIL